MFTIRSPVEHRRSLSSAVLCHPSSAIYWRSHRLHVILNLYWLLTKASRLLMVSSQIYIYGWAHRQLGERALRRCGHSEEWWLDNVRATGPTSNFIQPCLALWTHDRPGYTEQLYTSMNRTAFILKIRDRKSILIVLTDWLVLLLCVYLLAVGISVFKHPVKPSINRDIGEIHYVP